jgi:hypothetical protein
MRAKFVLMALVLVACPSGVTEQKEASEATQEGRSGSSDGVAITLERLPCFGICPVYKLVIRANHSVEYEGKGFVKLKGAAQARLTPEEFQRIVGAFEKARFSSLEDAYDKRDLSDQATTVLSYSTGSQRKTVRHYHGDASAPEALSRLEREIEVIVGVERWIGSDAERQDNAAEWK